MNYNRKAVRIPLFIVILAGVLIAFAITCILGQCIVTTAAKYTAANASTTEDGMFEYVELEDGTIEIAKYLGEENKVTIPELIDKKRVTKIGERAFRRCTSLTQIELPNSITTIGYEAFSECTALTQIELPYSITYISFYAFEGCTALIEINVAINNEIYSSEDGVLFDKNKTELIVYPAGKADKKYEIPETVISISGYAFFECENLTEIALPNSITRIGPGVFEGCTNLTKINLPDKITSIEDNAFGGCASLRKIELPDGITNIGDYAFGECKNLTQIELPEKIDQIGEMIFWDSILNKVVVNNTEPIELPSIIKRVMNPNDILYSKEGLAFINCSLNKDETQLIINKEAQNWENIEVFVKDGPLALLTLRVVNSGTITYETTAWNDDFTKITEVIATLHLAEGETITNNNGKNTYLFKQNGEFKFEYIDINGETKTATAKVKNIGLELPDTIEVESIEVTKKPIKTQYNANENFDPKGMEVTLTFTDGEEIVTTDYSILNGNNLTCLIEEIKIQYNENTEIETTLPIKVSHNYENDKCTYCGKYASKIIVTTDKYEISEEYITRIPNKITVNDLKENIVITNATEIKFFNKKNEEIKDGDKIGTGTTLVIKYGSETKTLQLVVAGDATGDGIADFKDMVAINRHRLNKKSLDGAYSIAGDVTGDGKIDFNDMVKIKRFRLNKIMQFF